MKLLNIILFVVIFLSIIAISDYLKEPRGKAIIEGINYSLLHSVNSDMPLALDRFKKMTPTLVNVRPVSKAA